MSKQYDLIIIGAGAAGLSFLLALDAQGYRGSILIVESADSFNTHKTWSFWLQDEMPNYLKKIIKKKWRSWRLSYQNQSVIHDCPSQEYASIDAKDFFDLVTHTIRNSGNVELLFNTAVHSVERDGSIARLTSGNSQYSAAAVIDTRPIKNQAPKNGLYQSFYGIEVNTTKHCFNDKEALIMGDLIHSEFGIEFLYMLPFSSTHALIEYTCFNTSPIPPSALKEKAQVALSAFMQTSDFKLLRNEYGILPMCNIAYDKSASSSVIIKAGIAGGAMRASTGYCFQPIQRWATALAKEFSTSQTLSIINPISPLYRCLDEIFLTVMTHNKALGSSILFRFAKGMEASAFARFMSEKASKRDLIKVIMVMPKWIFIKALFRYLLASKGSKSR